MQRRRRKDAAAEEGGETGIPWQHVPGGGISGRLWEKHNSEAMVNHFTSSLFADETTLLGGEMKGAVAGTKEIMT